MPKSWNALSADRVFKGGSLDEFVDQNPETKALIDSLKSPDSVMKFVAFDPAVRDAFATNMNVVVEPLPAGTTIDAYVEAALGRGLDRPALAHHPRRQPPPTVPTESRVTVKLHPGPP